MAPVDAQLLWLSAVVPNDQFLVFGFDGEPDICAAVGQLRRNAEGCEDLRLRVVDDSRWRYPCWRRGGISPEQFTVYDETDWQGCLDAVVGFGQLDATRMAWRVHIFPPRTVVIQMAHALADGTRGTRLAGAMLGRRAPIPPVAAPQRRFLPRLAVTAARAHRRLVRETEAGLLPGPNGPRPALSVNARPSGTPVLRTLVVERQRLRRPTVTVGALVAIAEALGGYLADRGEDVSRLVAEVPMAPPASINGGVHARNNFRNVTVGLYPELGRAERAQRIAGDLGGQRRRSGHAATITSAAAFAAMPAWLLRWGMRQFDAGVRSETVTGNTVVSSVNRGPADLALGGCPVTLTAGFPALSPMMSLTHGVHGIGDVVAVSVHADAGVVHVDDYVARLADALGLAP